MSEQSPSERPAREPDADADEAREKPPGARDSQRPIGEYESREGNWLTGDDPNDPLREEAAERASRAVEPGKPRE
jgi:hypothetical protein